MSMPFAIDDTFISSHQKKDFPGAASSEIEFLKMKINNLESIISKMKSREEEFNAHLVNSSEAFNQFVVERKNLMESVTNMRKAISAMLEGCALIRTSYDHSTLLQDICNILIHSGYSFAWAGVLVSNPVNEVIPVIFSGPAAKAPVLSSPFCPGRLIGSTVDEAVHTGLPSVCNDLSGGPFAVSDLFVENCRSVVSIPISEDANVYGVISVYDETSDAFTEDEVLLLQEIVSNFPASILTDFAIKGRIDL